MKDRLIALAGALLSLYLVIALLAPPASDSGPTVSRPTTEDRGAQGLYALQRWLSQSDVPTRSFRLRYDELILETGEGGGHLLVLSLPQHFAAREHEKAALLDWLSIGNHALVFAAVHDAPPWAGPQRLAAINAFLADLGLRFTAASRQPLPREERRRRALRALLTEAKTEVRTLVPSGPLPVLQGIDALEMRLEPPAPERYRLRAVTGDQVHLVLLHDAETSEPDFWAVRIGQGRLWLSAYGGLFSNAGLAAAGNAQLAANLIGTVRGGNGVVWFDDMHQGLSALYDPQAFFRDARVHYSLLFMLVFWLLYVVGRSNRLGPVQPRPEPPRAIAFVQAAAGFLARRLTRPAAARALLAAFFNELRAQHGLPLNGEPLWDPLRRAATPAQFAALERWQQGGGGRRPNLIALTQLLTELRRKML